MAGLVVVYAAAAAFLSYHESPRPSEAVVLFIGPDYPERKKEALQLMEEGYAARLLIPALNQTRFKLPAGLDRSQYPDYYENTHIEALEAKKMMDAAGYTSAIFVSSPYHMRRISMISKAVFQDERYQLTFRGSRYARTDGFLSLFHWSEIQNVFEEYFKIVGFLVYQAYERVIPKTVKV